MSTNKIMLTILLICLCLGIQAQTLLTLEAGVNNSSVNTKNIPEARPSDINNYFFGAGIGYRFTPFFELKGDLSYVTKGYDMRFGENQLDVIVYNYDYLVFAPHLTYRPTKIFSLGAGISYSQKLRERSREASFMPGNWVESNSIGGSDLSINFMAKFHFQFFYFKMMYESGMININQIKYTDQNGNTIEGSSLKNKSIQVGVGFYLWG